MKTIALSGKSFAGIARQPVVSVRHAPGKSAKRVFAHLPGHDERASYLQALLLFDSDSQDEV
ncbi:hypothetical protein ACFIOY_01710 [Bradyrhizobium sp. TZ2]